MSIIAKSSKFALSCRDSPVDDSNKSLLKGFLHLLSYYIDAKNLSDLDDKSKRNIFDHLAEGLPYTSRRKPDQAKKSRRTEQLYKTDETENEDRCSSRLSSIRPIESPEETDLYSNNDLSELPATLDSLSLYCYNEWDEAYDEDVIFIDVLKNYSLSCDILCKFIINHLTTKIHPEDRIVINQYSEDDFDGNRVLEGCLVYLTLSHAGSRLKRRSILEIKFPITSLNKILTDKAYRFEYISCKSKKIFGRSEWFSLGDGNSSAYCNDDDDDGFIFVDT